MIGLTCHLARQETRFDVAMVYWSALAYDTRERSARFVRYAPSLMLADGRLKTVPPKLRFVGRRPRPSFPRVSSKRPAAYFLGNAPSNAQYTLRRTATPRG